jgi:hypothetical protein
MKNLDRVVSITKVLDTVLVSSNTTVYSNPIAVWKEGDFGLIAQIDVNSTSDVKFFYQVIESAAGDVNNVGNRNGEQWVTPESNAEIISSLTGSATTRKADGFQPMVTKWIRIGATGNTSNGVGTYVSAWLMSQ